MYLIRCRHIVPLAVASLVFMLSAQGCAHASKRWHFPLKYRDAVVEGLNSQWDALPDDNGSVGELLTLMIAYREFREQFGDDDRVNRTLRKYENALWFWDGNFKFMAGVTESTGYYRKFGKFAGRGEPLLVGEAFDADPADRYEHSDGNRVALCALGSAKSFRRGFFGVCIPNVTGAPLTRVPPQDIAFTPLETYTTLLDATKQYRQQPSPKGAVVQMLKVAACFISNPKHPVASAAVQEAVNAVLADRPMSLMGVGEAVAENILKNELNRMGYHDLVEAAETAELIDCAYRGLQ